MSYVDEDEVDWSDGPLDPPSPGCIESVAPSRLSPVVEEHDDDDALFLSDRVDKYNVPFGQPLNSPLTHGDDTQPALSRAQRARIGVHLNRRIPSKEDYANFALYQANQKAYEATFVKSFVTHALHSDFIDECFQNSADAHAEIREYLELVSSNVNYIANKMVWNAHCRAVNLLANDGKDGAPFLDVHTFNSNVFSDFGPGSPVLVARRMNESWHRANRKPAMVRLSTREYPIRRHNAPLEEVDEVANTLFNKNGFGKTLPTGRAARPPVTKKGKGRDLPGAAVRQVQPAMSRGNWLAFPSLKTGMDHYSPPTTIHSPQETTNSVEMFEAEHKAQLVQGLHNGQQSDIAPYPHASSSSASLCTPNTSPTQLEMLFDRYGFNALESDRVDSSAGSDSSSLVEKVHSWRQRLIDDHKRRLTERWGNPPQALRRALPGIKQALAQALAMGFRPIAADFEERVEIVAARERNKCTPFPQAREGLCLTLKTGSSTERTTSEQTENGQKDVVRRITDNGKRLANSTKPKRKAHGSREQKKCPSVVPYSTEAPSSRSSQPRSVDTFREDKGKNETFQAGTSKEKQYVESPKKRRKVDAPTRKQKTAEAPTRQKTVAVKSAKQSERCRELQNSIGSKPLPPHPSGSTTLEPHQTLPPDGYFVPTSIDEKPAWRCGIKHAIGYYYNAGDRKSCKGCNTSLSDNPKIKVMDFYLPSRSCFYQPAPGVEWRPNKPSGKTRKSHRPCHNSIAKDAYWAAVEAGATEDEARQIGVNAVVEFLRPKPRKEPTPELTPEPEPDLGPHPSGSATMEHGQDRPECAYTKKQERHEDFAWRCDVNHALGRYYLAGDKKSCPGCGTNKGGLGKQTVMDFYIPYGVILRQEAPHLVKWKPRKYKARKSSSPKSSSSKSTKTKNLTHNQICAEKYFQAIDQGHEDEEALRIAVESTDAYVDAKAEEAIKKQDVQEESEESEEIAQFDNASSPHRSHSANPSLTSSTGKDTYCRNSGGGYGVSKVLKKRNINDLSDDEMDEVEEYMSHEDTEGVSTPREAGEFSSTEEESSQSASD